MCNSLLNPDSDIGNTETRSDQQGDCKGQWPIRFSALAVFSQKLLCNRVRLCNKRLSLVNMIRLFAFSFNFFAVTNHRICCHSVVSAWTFYNFFSFSKKHSLYMNSVHISERNQVPHISGQKGRGKKSNDNVIFCYTCGKTYLDPYWIILLIFSSMSIIAEQREDLRDLIALCTER